MTPKSSFLLLVAFEVAVLISFGPALKMDVKAQGEISDVNISALLNSFQMGYDKRVRPNYGGPAVVVGVTMYVLSISSLSEVQMDFTLDMYFRQFWTDPRLSFDRPGLKKLVVGADYIKLIWVPDTFFVNEKTAYFHKATTENQFLRILHTGEILRSIRLTITASCPMNLQYFPMDRQLCYIEIESFGYTMSDIHYKWNDGLNSVQIAADVSLPQFKVMGHRQKTIEASLSTGNYSRLACEIQFVRSMGYYMIQIYIPSSLIVIISWVSFWLNRGASPARVGLGVTTVLTMTTLMASTNAALPKVSYVKSIDVYLGACFFLVFTSLLEYATVGYMAKRIQMRKNRYLTIQKNNEAKKPEPVRQQAPIMMNPSMQGSLGRGPMQQIRPGLNNGMGDQHQKHSTVHFKVNELNMQYKTPQERAISPYLHSGMKYGRGPPPQAIQMNMMRYNMEMEGPPPPPPHPIPMSPKPLPPLQMPLLPPPAPNPDCDAKDLNRLFGMTASDIDKYSRIFFPVTFTCFQLMYWIIYSHLSDDVVDDLVYLNAE